MQKPPTRGLGVLYKEVGNSYYFLFKRKSLREIKTITSNTYPRTFGKCLVKVCDKAVISY